ncbi:hypothetical protein ABE41_019005 [Fictibacillus arsenicus]|uniref:Uncharacterized protein n=1 Tax=Fictibacillus arsenicus TaxID=255247 RepID=A0A1B1Z9J4_9BACL|nr:hypothetical protein ABE41_019005 [Fictibacillus arsenicus]
MLAFRGACGEPTRRLATLNGLTCPADPAGVSHLALQSTCNEVSSQKRFKGILVDGKEICDTPAGKRTAETPQRACERGGLAVRPRKGSGFPSFFGRSTARVQQSY